MNGDKSPDTNKLMKQGKGLATAAVCLAVLALLLIVVLIDRSFVPSGELWEECKASLKTSMYVDIPADEAGLTDRQIWERAKDGVAQYLGIPFKSGFLSWGLFLYTREQKLAREAHRNEQLRMSQEAAETIMDTFNDYLSEKEIRADFPRIVHIDLRPSGRMNLYDQVYRLPDSGDFLVESGDFLVEEDKTELKARLSEILPDTDKSAAEVFVREGKCTAAVYAPDVNYIDEGTDFPYFDENGCFDNERMWGGGRSEVHNNRFIIGYIDENGVKP